MPHDKGFVLLMNTFQWKPIVFSAFKTWVFKIIATVIIHFEVLVLNNTIVYGGVIICKSSTTMRLKIILTVLSYKQNELFLQMTYIFPNFCKLETEIPKNIPQTNSLLNTTGFNSKTCLWTYFIARYE